MRDKPYQLYQLKRDGANEAHRFVSYAGLKRLRLKVEPHRYRQVYTGQMDKGTSLTQLFNRFNNPCTIPSDYMARSLSVSDLIVTGGKVWYVDSFGFRDVTDEVGGIPLDTEEEEH